MNFNFIKPTIIFCAVGIFIPGFTAILFLLFQTLLAEVGIGCELYWKSTFIVMGILSIVSPLVYVKYLTNNKPTQTNLLLFNFIEYNALQIGLSQLLITPNMTCFGQSDGAMVFILTAWIALPILVCLSFIFRKRFKSLESSTTANSA